MQGSILDLTNELRHNHQKIVMYYESQSALQ